MFKHFLTFLAILATLNLGVAYTATSPIAEAKPAALQSSNYLAKITSLGITATSNAPSNVSRKPTFQSVDHCASLIYKTLLNLPQTQVTRLKNLTLTFDSNARRGLGGGGTIILRCVNVTDQELVGVLVHEMGHVQDTGVMQGSYQAGSSEFKDGDTPIYKDDESLEFYRISFNSENHKLASATDDDFVSGYAQSNVFEDFAETYNYYILHGIEFRQLMKTNLALAQKYYFMKDKVFSGQEFNNGDLDNISNSDRRNYDATILAYQLNKFFIK
jgi:hypothetical protein